MTARNRWALLQARRALIPLLSSSVEVWRASSTSDGQGGVTGDPPARVATLPGFVEPPTESATVYAEKQGYIASAVINLPHDAAVTTGDELRVAGHRYSIVGTDVGGTDALVKRAVVSEAR